MRFICCNCVSLIHVPSNLKQVIRRTWVLLVLELARVGGGEIVGPPLRDEQLCGAAPVLQ